MRSFLADTVVVWNLLQVCIAHIQLYSVTAPKSYVALSGDIETNYNVPTNTSALRIQLTDITSGGERHLVKKEIPKSTLAGKLIFPCGIVDRAGKVEFRIITAQGEKILAKSDVMHVLWPKVEVHVPLLVETYSSDFIVELQAGISCHPREEENYKINLELVYLGPSLPSSSQGTSWYHYDIILTKPLPPLFSRKLVEVSLDCDIFDRAGYHKIQLRIADDDILAESETVRVLWSPRYSVNVPKSAIEPCLHGIKVLYGYPRCILDQDRIRVYGTKKRKFQDAEYLFERMIKKGRHSTTLTCDLFSEEYNMFCFVYVSKANNGAVFELARQCVSRKIDPGGISTEWSAWSDWSSCSATCANGVRTRYRLCNIPVSEGNCDGRPVETEACNNKDCPEMSTFIVEESPLISSQCWCGCVINATLDGVLSAHKASCIYPVVWTLHAPHDYAVFVEFKQLNLRSDQRWLVIRDGRLAVGSILEVIKEDHPLPPPLQSMGDTIRIELYTASNMSSVKGEIWFKLAYRTAEAVKSMAVIHPSFVPEGKLGAVHIVFVVLAAFLGTTTVSFLLYYHFRCIRLSEGKASIRSASPCSFAHHHHPEEELCPNTHLLAANTSVSEISASPLPPRKICNSEQPQSPEDYLHNCFIFRRASEGSTLSVTESSAGPSPFVPKRTLPIAAVSPQPQSRKSALKHTDESNVPKHKHTTVVSPVIRRDKLTSKGAKTVQRESSAPLTASLSEFSINESEDGFEYDYYDYGCHDVPGSFFCTDPMFMDWPPFIPIPPQQLDDLGYPLQHFTPSPNESQEVQSTKS